VSRELLLALDLGTTGVRALVVRPDGGVLSRAYHVLSTSYPSPSHVEQDPQEIWQASVEMLREALATAACRAKDVAGIGVVTQRSTTVAWDSRSGRPLAPAIGWQDQRTAPRVAWFRERGLPLTAMASATKFEWWMQNDPEVQKAAARGSLQLGTPDTWLTHCLTAGEAHVTDPSQASCTALYDLERGSWIPEFLSVFGVPEGALPKIVATSEVVGETPRSLLGGAIPVAARAGDQQAATFAQGIHSPGQAKLTLGTAAMLDLHTGPHPREASPGTYALALWRLSDGTEAFCLEGTVITAGSIVEWLVELGLLPDASSLDRVAGSVPSSEGAIFVPSLQGLGTPFLDDSARGLLGGLTRGTGAAHVVRAAVEGVAHRCVDISEALGLERGELSVDGGLGRSDLLLQTLADLLGREVWRAAETETTALGAAHLAGLATGVFEEPAACRASVPPPTCFGPSLGEDQRREARERWRRALERAGSEES
jgi:glycerol kinase